MMMVNRFATILPPTPARRRIGDAPAKAEVLPGPMRQAMFIGLILGLPWSAGAVSREDAPEIADTMEATIALAEKAIQAAVPEAEKDPFRPGFHFRAPAQFMNDICGALYYQVATEIDPGDTQTVGLRLRPVGGEQGEVTVTYHGHTVNAAGTEVPDVACGVQKTLRLQLFFDKSIIELFINDGRQAVTRVAYPGSHDIRVELFANGGKAVVKSAEVWELTRVERQRRPQRAREFAKHAGGEIETHRKTQPCHRQRSFCWLRHSARRQMPRRVPPCVARRISSRSTTLAGR